MPRLSRRIRLAALVLAWLCPVWSTPVAAEENGGRQWSAELGVGVEYDSNVSVDEVDVTSSQGDYALTLDAGFALKQPLSGSANAALTYDFSSSNIGSSPRWTGRPICSGWTSTLATLA